VDWRHDCLMVSLLAQFYYPNGIPSSSVKSVSLYHNDKVGFLSQMISLTT